MTEHHPYVRAALNGEPVPAPSVEAQVDSIDNDLADEWARLHLTPLIEGRPLTPEEQARKVETYDLLRGLGKD